MITGTSAVSELGAPISPSALGPSQPSPPTTHMMESTSPVSVSSISERARVKSSSSAAISSSASPMSGPIPSSVARLYSSSMTAGERLLTRSGPSLLDASSLMARSASGVLSSPVSMRRMVAIATGAPFASDPVNAVRACGIPGASRTASICAWETDSKLSTCSAAAMRWEGAITELAGASSPLTARVAGDVVQQGVHLREPVGRESVAAEEERYDTDLTGVSEVLVDFLRRCDEGVVGRKEGEVGAFRRRGSERSPYDHSHGDEHEHKDGEPRANRD